MRDAVVGKPRVSTQPQLTGYVAPSSLDVADVKDMSAMYSVEFGQCIPGSLLICQLQLTFDSLALSSHLPK